MKVSIIGATGYAGAEILRILHNHPQVSIVHITSESHAGENIADLYPQLTSFCNMTLESMDNLHAIGEDSDFIFIALPHSHAMKVGQELKDLPVRLIDLGADYRFTDTNIYEEWYHVQHIHKDARRVYGLPEIYREEIKTAQIIGCAGCFTTASILALAPLAKHHLIDMDTIIIDAKSGVSGAGRSPKIGNHFPELYENFKAYGVASHRHTPEIEQALSDMAKEDAVISFTPHLVPMSRGIFATCYAKLKNNVSAELVSATFQKMYHKEQFIRLRGLDAYVATKDVRGSNFCDIAWHIDNRTGRVIVFSVIDNLVKGAAGQAVQNFNIACGFEEDTALNFAPLYP